MDGKERCSTSPRRLVYPIRVEIAEVWAFWMSVVTLGARSSLSVLGRHLASCVSDCSKGLLVYKSCSWPREGRGCAAVQGRPFSTGVTPAH